MKRKSSLRLFLEEYEFVGDTKYTLSNWLSKKWSNDTSGFSLFFGEPELIKKWKINPSTGLRSLPRVQKSDEPKADMFGTIRDVDTLLAKNPSELGQSNLDTRKEILLYWAQQISGKEEIFKEIPDPEDPKKMKKVLDIPETEWKQAKDKARSEIYNRIWKDIPPDIVLQRLTIPDPNLKKLFRFMKANIIDPDENDPRAPKIGIEDYEEKKQQWDGFIEEVKLFATKMKGLNPSQRARYLFNLIMFAKGGPRKPRDLKGAPERGQLKAITPKDPNAKWIDPEKAGRKYPKFTRPWKPYRSKKKREDDKKKNDDRKTYTP